MTEAYLKKLIEDSRNLATLTNQMNQMIECLNIRALVSYVDTDNPYLKEIINKVTEVQKETENYLIILKKSSR